MTRFGGNEFTKFSVPLVFAGRYFILEPGPTPLLSVFLEAGGEPVFEVLKNEPKVNAFSEVKKSGAKVITVSDKVSNKFLYKVRPGSETSVAFGKLDGGELSVRISDTKLQVGGITLEGNTFNGVMAGVVVTEDGEISIGAQLPPAVVALITAK